MKINLIFPPQWDYDCPYPSLPYLSSFLKQHGYNVVNTDLNIKWQNLIFSPEYLRTTVDKINKVLQTSVNQKEVSNARRALELFKLLGEEVFAEAVNTLRTEKDLGAVRKALLTLDIGNFIISAPHFPAYIYKGSMGFIDIK